jgi:hypothetical protein
LDYFENNEKAREIESSPLDFYLFILFIILLHHHLVEFFTIATFSLPSPVRPFQHWLF